MARHFTRDISIHPLGQMCFLKTLIFCFENVWQPNTVTDLRKHSTLCGKSQHFPISHHPVVGTTILATTQMPHITKIANWCWNEARTHSGRQLLEYSVSIITGRRNSSFWTKLVSFTTKTNGTTNYWNNNTIIILQHCWNCLNVTS